MLATPYSLCMGVVDEPVWQTPQEKIKFKVNTTRDAHQSKVQPGGRANGGNRTKDLVLQHRFLFNTDHLRSSLNHQCGCGDACCSQFDVEMLRMIRAQTYDWKPNIERSNEVFKDLYSRLEYKPTENTVHIHYWLLRIEVCRDAYFFIRYGQVSPSTRKRIMERLEGGATEWKTQYKHRMSPILKLYGLKKDDTMLQILSMAKIFGDEQPDDTGEFQEIHLDPGISKGWLYYNEYLDKCIERSTDPVSCSYFMHVWNTSFTRKSCVQFNGVKYVLKLRDENRKKRFHECSRCARLKKGLAEAPPEATALKARIREELMLHYTGEVRVEIEATVLRSTSRR